MAINPAEITTVRIDQLANEALTLASILPHQIGTDLKQANIQQLVDFVATQIGAGTGVGFLALAVTDGQQLPDVPEDPSFFLAGAGTYLNINGYPDIICTENLNAIMSLSDHWELAVEIPITPLIPLVESVTGALVNNTDPLNPVINTPTLQQVLDNNHDLVDNNNFQGTDAGNGNTGININGFGANAAKNQTGSRNNAFGNFSLEDNTGDDVNGFGRGSASTNSGNHINAFGNEALQNNSGNNANAFGDRAGDGNTHANVNLFGLKAEADAANQTVFSKGASDQIRVSFTNVTGYKKVELQNSDGTLALLTDCDTNAILNNIGNGSIIDQAYLPSFVDDVLEFANLAAFPVTGATGKIYIALDTNKQYRWTGTVYVQITNGFIASTDDVPEGGSNLYFTVTRVLNTLLTGISFSTGRVIAATDTILEALGILQKQISDILVIKADVNSPAFTGLPTAPTMAANDNSTRLATTAYVDANITEYPETTYSQTITYTSISPPSGGLTANYRATRVGKCVSVRLNFKNAVAGTGVSVAIIPFPSGLPSPGAITDFNTNNDFIGTGSGVFQTGANSGVASRVVIRKVSGGYEIHLIASSASYISGIVNFQYFIS
jgi:hypothetical protein